MHACATLSSSGHSGLSKPQSKHCVEATIVISLRLHALRSHVQTQQQGKLWYLCWSLTFKSNGGHSAAENGWRKHLLCPAI